MRGHVNRLVKLGAGVLGMLTVAASGAGAAPLGGRAPSPPARAAAPAATPAWLTEVNRYRVAAGDAPVTDNPAWDAGLLAHFVYLQRTPAKYLTGPYASAHTENPASPYYTPAGATEGQSSDLALGGAGSPVQAVDGWLTSPFHAIGILRAQLREVALAVHDGFAGIDVIQGLDPLAPPATAPILFPGPGMTTNLLRYSGAELPSPLQTCNWTQAAAIGLPLIALLPQAPAAGASATVRGPGATESTAARTVCLVDEHTFRTSDQVYGPAGRAILQGDHAVLVIPRHPLVGGRYTATLSQPGQPAISWSFTALGTRTAIARVLALPGALRVALSAPAGAQPRCALSRWLGHRFAAARYEPCSRAVVYRGLRPGRYRFSVRSRDGDASRVVVIPRAI